ncbi:Rossmann-like and DUF2520 domain-containing protein [soil metagenome]
MILKNKNICIIGMGKLGSALAIELSESGAKVKYLIGKYPMTLKAVSKKIKSSITSKKIEKEIINDSDIIFIAVRDIEIEKTAKAVFLACDSFKNKIIFHSSGSMSSGIMKSGKISTNNLASIHPIQSFNKVSIRNGHLLKNIYFGIEGGKTALSAAKNIAFLLGSKYIVIPESRKYIYHIASIFASNYLVVLADMLISLGEAAGEDPDLVFEIYEPIIRNTMNNIMRFGPEGALTGPVERNDQKLIEEHLKTLNKSGRSVLPVYKVLGNAAADIAYRKGSLNKDQKLKLKKLFDRSIPTLKSNSKN